MLSSASIARSELLATFFLLPILIAQFETAASQQRAGREPHPLKTHRPSNTLGSTIRRFLENVERGKQMSNARHESVANHNRTFLAAEVTTKTKGHV